MQQKIPKVIVPDVVLRGPAILSTPPLLLKSIFPVPVLIAPAGRVKTVPAIAVIPVFAPKTGAERVSALTSVTETLTPLLLNPTAPVKSLAFVRVIAFAPAVKLAAPAPAACVIVVTPLWAYRTCCIYS